MIVLVFYNMFLKYLLFFCFISFQLFASNCEKPKMPSNDDWNKWLSQIKSEAIEKGIS